VPVIHGTINRFNTLVVQGIGAGSNEHGADFIWAHLLLPSRYLLYCRLTTYGRLATPFTAVSLLRFAGDISLAPSL
jgi:hypothetical protein